MQEKTAKLIAELLNRRNKLPNKLSSGDVLYGNYFYIATDEGTKDEKILACARAKCMSFFCYELKHLAVREEYGGKGLAQTMVEIIEAYVRLKKVPILLATTRADNLAVKCLFTKLGYQSTKEFVNDGTKQPLILWKKELI